jgi:hypothetical protein
MQKVLLLVERKKQMDCNCKLAIPHISCAHHLVAIP